MEPKELVVALERMLEIREAEEAVLELSREGVVSGSVHLCLGQEAVPVGVRYALDANDTAIGTYRGHGWAIAWGAPVEGVIAEIAHKRAGTNGGRAGSLLLSHPETGFLGQNSIVGAGVPIAAGVALAYKYRSENRVIAVSFGDGAMNQGGVHEAFSFAASNNLPIIFSCENNGWSEMTPISATVRTKDLVDRAKGYGIQTRIVDGQNVADVVEATRWAAEICRAGQGPVFLEFKTYRLKGHYNRDIEHYRPTEDSELARENDPITRLQAQLVAEGTLSAADAEELASTVKARIAEVVNRVRVMPAATTQEDTARTVSSSAVVSVDPEILGDDVELTYQRALNLALRRELESRPEVLLFGEDIGVPGGVHGVTRSLQKDFGVRRVFDTPIAETAILGAAVGSAMAGLRPIVEIMWADFLFVAFDQIVNQASNVRFLNNGELEAPLTIRTQQGITPGACAQHSQSVEALLAHIPGVQVGLATTPHDAYHMLRAAVASHDPVIIIEDRSLYQTKGVVRHPNVIESVGKAVRRTRGDQVAIITWGQATKTALAAADKLKALGTSALVLDLRWLRPLDEEGLINAVRDTGGNAVIVHDAPTQGGFGAEVLATLYESALRDTLNVVRVGGAEGRIPAAPGLQSAVVPSSEDVITAVRSLLSRTSTLV